MTTPIRPKVRTDLAVVELDGEAVIYDPDGGGLHHLNPTATVIFSVCDGTATVKELAADIGKAFRMSPQEIERQVRALLRELRRGGLLEGAGKGADG